MLRSATNPPRVSNSLKSVRQARRMSQPTMKLRLFHAVLYAPGNNKGAAMVEYALLCALVAIVAAGSLTRLGQALSQGALYLAFILNAAGR